VVPCPHAADDYNPNQECDEYVYWKKAEMTAEYHTAVNHCRNNAQNGGRNLP
jgi:hypothetical protein